MNEQLLCPNCGADILAEDINIHQLVAKCHACNHVFQFDAKLAAPGRHRSEILLPPGIEAYSLLSELNIEINWRKIGGLGFFLFFTIFWNAIVLPFAFFAILSGNLMILLFLSLHLTVGIGMLYYVIAHLVNTTYINVTRRYITIEHKPVRWLFSPNRSLHCNEVKQLFVTRYVASTTNGQPNHAFKVTAIMQSDENIELIKGLRTIDQARYIEQQVERFLNIKDVEVEGEY